MIEDDDAIRLSPADLCGQLSITRDRLEELIADGLPYTNGHNSRRTKFHWDKSWFVDDRVAEWLIEHGMIAKPRLVNRLSDVANHFGISERALGYWRTKGAPLSSDVGYYDLDALEHWVAANINVRDSTEGSRADHETELARIRAERAQLELDEKRFRLLPAELVGRVTTRAITEAKALLEQLPEWFVTEFDPKTPSAELARKRDRAREKLDNVLTVLVGINEELAAELERAATNKKRRAT